MICPIFLYFFTLFLFYGSPCFVRPLRIIFLIINRANAAKFVIVGFACSQILRIQIGWNLSVLGRKECLLAVTAVFLHGTVNLKTINLITSRLRPWQKNLFVLCELGLQCDTCVFNPFFDIFYGFVCRRVCRVSWLTWFSRLRLLRRLDFDFVAGL